MKTNKKLKGGILLSILFALSVSKYGATDINAKVREEINKEEKSMRKGERKKNMKSLTPFIIICVILALFDFLAAFSPNVCVHIPIDLKIMVLSLKQWFLIDSAICFLGVIMFGMGVLIPKDSKCFIVIMCYGVLVFGLKIFWLIIQTMIFVEGVSNQ